MVTNCFCATFLYRYRMCNNGKQWFPPNSGFLVWQRYSNRVAGRKCEGGGGSIQRQSLFPFPCFDVVFTHVCDFFWFEDVSNGRAPRLNDVSKNVPLETKQHWKKLALWIRPIRCSFKCPLSSSSHVCLLKSKSPRLKNAHANLQ